MKSSNLPLYFTPEIAASGICKNGKIFIVYTCKHVCKFSDFKDFKAARGASPCGHPGNADISLLRTQQVCLKRASIGVRIREIIDCKHIVIRSHQKEWICNKTCKGWSTFLFTDRGGFAF